MNDTPARQVTIDFVAIVVVGIMLALLLALSIFLNVYALDQRADEHDRIIARIDHLICETHPHADACTAGQLGG